MYFCTYYNYNNIIYCIQIFWVGLEEWHKTKIKHLVYNDPDAATPILIDVPFWKCSYHCYLDILFSCGLDPNDYPWQIGPYPCPLTWVSYMESTFQFCVVSNLISSHLICGAFN